MKIYRKILVGSLGTVLALSSVSVFAENAPAPMMGPAGNMQNMMGQGGMPNMMGFNNAQQQPSMGGQGSQGPAMMQRMMQMRQQNMPMMSAPNDAGGTQAGMGMMGGKGMPMMNMMQQKQAMMKEHMTKMENHLANIENLLRQLVAQQNKR